MVTWKEHGLVPQVEEIVLFWNELIYPHKILAARIQALLRRKNREVYRATIVYRREVGRRTISNDRHLNQQIRGLFEDGAARTLTPDTSTQLRDAQDEFTDYSFCMLKQIYQRVFIINSFH